MARSMACAWAEDNIQVNAILPGWINTELTRRARQEIEGLQEKATARTPAGRWGEPHDLAGAAIFLASAASDYVTGVALPRVEELRRNYPDHDLIDDPRLPPLLFRVTREGEPPEPEPAP